MSASASKLVLVQPVPIAEEDDDSATEGTPLIASETSSQILRGHSREQDDGGDGDGDGDGDGYCAGAERAGSEISWMRAALLVPSMFLMLLLLGSNISGMMLIQSIIAQDLNVQSQVQWVTTSYVLAASSASPIYGRLADIFGPRALLAPFTAFLAGGILVSALAPSIAVFYLGRVLGGIGGGGVFALAWIIVLELTTPRTRGFFFGMINTGMTLSVMIGTIVYGALCPVIGWRALLCLMIPISLASSLAIYLVLPASIGPTSHFEPLRKKVGRIDYVGSVLLVLAISLFLYGLSDEVQPLPVIVSLVVLAMFIAVEFRVAVDPIIPVSVLSSPAILLSCLVSMCVMISRWSLLFYLPVVAIGVRGYSLVAAGAVLVPATVSFAIGGLVVGAFHIRRRGAFWSPSLISIFFVAVSLWAVSLAVSATVPIVFLAAAVFLNGLAASSAMSYTLVHMLHLTVPGAAYVATGLLSTFRSLGSSFGSAIPAGIFSRMLRADLAMRFAALDGGGPLSPERAALVARLSSFPAMVHSGALGPDEKAAAVASYETAARRVWLAAAALTLLMVGFQALTGWRAPQGDGKCKANSAERTGEVRESEDVAEV